MDDEAPPPQEEETAGAPAWMATFADLATLLMSFFVLILSFSELDVLKYKQIAGSLAEAFGVQREVKSRESPRGVNIIAKEFSPGKPQPTPLNRVKQDTTSSEKKYIKIRSPEGESGQAPKVASNAAPAQDDQPRPPEPDPVDVEKVRQALKQEIERGVVDVSVEDKKVVIRIRERGTFPSGDAGLVPQFKPVIAKIRDVLTTIPGQVVVAGHTDNVPILTTRFRSNWELSSARAVSVVQELLGDGRLPAGRFQVVGYAATKPMGRNDSVAGRAANRRVELMIIQGSDTRGDDISAQGVRRSPAPSADNGNSQEPTDAVELMQANNSVLMELIRGFYSDNSAARGD